MKCQCRKNYPQMSLSRHHLVEECIRNQSPQTPLYIKEMQYAAFWHTTQLQLASLCMVHIEELSH
jgi:hypothetical protein